MWFLLDLQYKGKPKKCKSDVLPVKKIYKFLPPKLKINQPLWKISMIHSELEILSSL